MQTIVLGLVHKKDKILMIRRKEKDPEVEGLVWAFPGGTIKENELKEEALVREIKEETGVDIKVKNLIFARMYPEKDILLLYYDCKPRNEDLETSEPHEIAELGWVTGSEALKSITSDIHPMIADFLHKLK